jgi:hypothetical protein
MAKLALVLVVAVPRESVGVKVGVAASAFVVRKIPPSPAVFNPSTLQTMLLGLPGSNTISMTALFPVASGATLPAVVTVSFVNVTDPAADVAFVER